METDQRQSVREFENCPRCGWPVSDHGTRLYCPDCGWYINKKAIA